MSYNEFLESKVIRQELSGIEVDAADINPMLFEFQRDIVRWALQLGKAAVFAECGLGKTPIQLEWATHISNQQGPVLILAPLAVAGQTVREGEKFGIPVTYCRSQEQASGHPITVTNYEMLDHFDTSAFAGIVLDESSILKAFTGKTKRKIIDAFLNTPFKLACTATPAPNDYLELGNHAQFLDIMPSNEMISRWFINDSMQAGAYRLKKHAAADFWCWLTSWAVCMSTPSDLGYPDDGFILPELHIHTHTTKVDHSRAWEQGRLLLDARLSATDMWREKRMTAPARAAKAQEIANEDDYWIIWCDTNYEADELKRAFPEAIEVRGAHSVKRKEESLRAFSEGQERVIITKPGIAGFGLNWQHCRNQIFVGVTYSFERFYQALRRSYRFMVEGDVNVHLINAESEGNILDVLNQKGEEFQEMQTAMNTAMTEHGLFRAGERLSLQSQIATDYAHGDEWEMYLGDCVTTMRAEFANESLDFSVFSPPFSTLYIYSDSMADMGNAADHGEFFRHFSYLPRELYRAHKDGTRVAVHCKDLPLYMNRDGAAGLYDFPGDLIRSFARAGWFYERWVTVWKDPVLEMQRTKNHGLLHRNYTQRGEVTRQGMADFVLVFQKGQLAAVDNNCPVPDIAPAVIERAVDLWTNPGDVVVSPIDVGRGRVYEGHVNSKPIHFSFHNSELATYNQDFIAELYNATVPGRLAAVRCQDLGGYNMASEVIRRFGEWSDFVFHSRCALTDGTSFIVFRKWGMEFEDKQVSNYPIANTEHPDYVGIEPPQHWDNDEYYTIQVWQKYASPVWFDLRGLPREHTDIWFDIRQTNVLNVRQARANKDEKHICPLQLDLIDKCILQYTEPDDVVCSPFAGIGSEGVRAIPHGRKFRGIELKFEYFDHGCRYLAEAEAKAKVPDLFTWAGMQVPA